MKDLLIKVFTVAILMLWIGIILAQKEDPLLKVSAREPTENAYALLQKGRETGDGVYYEKAEEAFNNALKIDPQSYEAMNGLGVIHLNRHQFKKALEWGEKSLQMNPNKAYTYGILVDAYIELGGYERAAEMAKIMVNLRPDINAYSRISYLRELHGDLDGAIKAMQKAIRRGSGNLENLNWCRVQLGHLYFHKGNLKMAEKHYQYALYQNPRFGHALAGMGKVRAAQGNFAEAIYAYLQALEVIPIGEYQIALAEVYEVASMKSAAQKQFAEAIALLRQEKASGMAVDDELAALLAQCDQDINEALQLAQKAYERRPTVNIADILAWSYYKNGNLKEAAQASEKALQLGTEYAQFYFHTGMIAYELGDLEKAKQYLEKALALNPYFSLKDAKTARETLEKIATG